MKPYYEKNEIILYHDDCLDLLPEIPDKSIDLIVIDPPYNIGKDKWDKIDNYLEFMQQVFLQCERILKDNGSFYWFHNDFETICELRQLLKNTRFVFKQLIIWNKRFDGCKNEGFLDGFIETNQLRNYQQMVEYLLFYTFQDETGLTTVMLDTNNFSTLRQYFKKFQDDLGLTKKQIMEKFGQKTDHCFRWNSSQWDLPTEETYQQLLTLPSNGFERRSYESLRQEYESLRQEYESLRQEYESLRYTFNNQKTHHSVWNYEIPPKCGHVTPKPLGLIENIILHSSNEGDLILDCFAGSGTTGKAAKRLGRKGILIEKELEYCDLIVNRLEDCSEESFKLKDMGITQHKLF